MLAGMNNLAALAHAGDSNAPQFNAIFYATVATIIPVLFVAAVLQADIYTKLIETSHAAYRRFSAFDLPLPREGISALLIFYMTLLIPGFILLYGVWGEIQALLDLYLQDTTAGDFFGPGLAAIALTVTVAIMPAVRFGNLIYQTHRLTFRKTAENSPGEEPHEHGTATGEPSPPESGKPGSD